MKCLKIFSASLALIIATFAHAHPGSGIAVDDHGTVYFTDTGKGLWKLPPDGKIALISPMSYHFMGLDGTGAFSKSPPKFGRWFERATPEGSAPAVIECSEFPIAIGRDGNIYYANTLKRPTKIVKRTPAGKETVLTELADEAPTAAEKGRESYVTGITVAPDGSLYLVEAAAQAEFVVIRRVQMDGKVSVAARSFVPADLKFDSKP
ncbi:hypothetical protein HYR69_09845, partial [Candidatus Sumerlaeota bacterium]|nr:hypothetical protein [Candidatus Sumerlaeota bacterium]